MPDDGIVFFNWDDAEQLIGRLSPASVGTGPVAPQRENRFHRAKTTSAIAAAAGDSFSSGTAVLIPEDSDPIPIELENPLPMAFATDSDLIVVREGVTGRWLVHRCGANDCIGLCTGVEVPVSVTLAAPFHIGDGDPFAEVTWGLSATTTGSVCDLYTTNLTCGKENSFLTLRDMTCPGEWPAYNANDVRLALGASSSCGTCGYSVVSPRKIAYQEWKVSKRVVVKQKKAYAPRFRISSVSGSDYLRLELQIDYLELLARSVMKGVSNRVKIVTVECGSIPSVPLYGVVTDVQGWYYADEPVLTDPRMCFATAAVFCGEPTGNNDVYLGTCSESTVLLDHENGPGCELYPVYLETKVADAWCNVNLSMPPDDLQLCSYLSTFEEFLMAESGSSQRSFSIIWVGYVRCTELYDGPITLYGGPESGEVVLRYGTIIDPNGGEDGTEPVPGCTDAFTPLQRRWAVPTTISVTVNHA